LYETTFSPVGRVQGRVVNRAPSQYSIVWYESNAVRRKIVRTDEYHLIPLCKIEREQFEGNVFNMEVEGEHNYLAGFFLVSNCQNWLTSQAMRDSASDPSLNLIRKMTPRQMIDFAHSTNASAIVSSYNEPLITSEWAVEIFKAAKDEGLLR